MIASEKYVSGSTADITIETLTVNHFGPILKIEKSVFRDPWSAASFLEIMSFSPNNWVAISDGHLAGYIVTQWVLDEIHILNLAVAQAMQRRGIGSKLLEQVIAEGRKYAMRDLFLEVRTGNAPAVALYERFGFKPLSVRKKYYTDGADALVMHCPMPTNASDSTANTDGLKTEEN